MILLSAKQGHVLEQTCDLIVIGVFKGVVPLTSAIGELPEAMRVTLTQLVATDGFEGTFAEWFVMPTFGHLKAKKMAFVGLGDKKALSGDLIRTIGATIVKRAREAKAKTVVTTLIPLSLISGPDRAQAFAEGVWLGAYRFHSYKTKERDEAVAKDITSMTMIESSRQAVLNAEHGIKRARVIAEATILARDLVNTPSADMTPNDLAKAAESVAATSKRLSIKIMNRAAMEKLGMRAALSVARGSEQEPVGVHLIYRPSGKSKKKIMIVGKAVTFDSGGLSIKPADSMMTMKIDMAGAATVIGLFHALPHLDIKAEVHGIFLAVENMPSGRAYRPGDVVTAMNGTTIEVLNTDAEGRVTLADALSYAVTQKPDAMIDLATLTGACVVALGEEIAGLMTNDKKFGARVLAAAKESGEEIWELPLFPSYNEQIKSKVADIKNIGARGEAGAISAGLFLARFVENIPWVHLDIAGPSYAEKETRAPAPFGGTGFGVRLLARYLERLT